MSPAAPIPATERLTAISPRDGELALADLAMEFLLWLEALLDRLTLVEAELCHLRQVRTLPSENRPPAAERPILLPFPDAPTGGEV